MSSTDVNGSSMGSFFDSLGSVDKDLIYQVLGDTVESASEGSLKPLRYIAHQLRKEIDREKRKFETLRGQLRSVDRLIRKIKSDEYEETPISLFVITILHSRSEDLLNRLNESSLLEKENRLERLKRTMVGVQMRARVSKELLSTGVDTGKEPPNITRQD